MTVPDSERDAPEDIWLWPEGDGIRWWGADNSGLLADIAQGAGPSAVIEAANTALLLDRRVNWPIEFALRASLAGLLADLLSRHAVLRVHLHPALPASWHLFPFEWLRSDGQTLHGRISVHRMRAPDTVALAPISPNRDCVVLDLLPPRELCSPSRSIPDGVAQIISGEAAVSHFLASADLTALAALCLVAHGTEQGDGPAFRLPDGRPWSLPVERGLPPLVVLLACGDDQGNLIAEGRRALDAGADVVLAPLGRPTLAGGGHVLREILLRWRSGERLDDLLRALSALPDGEAGARRFLLLGRGETRMDKRLRLRERDDAWLLAAIRSDDEPVGGEALAELVRRLTLQGFAAGEDLNGAEDRLRALLAVERHDDQAQGWLFERLTPIEPALPALARAWVAPLLAWLAEAYGQDWIERLKRVRDELDARQVPCSAPMLHYWSKLYYRHGQYELALQDVARGLMAMDRREFMPGSGPLGAREAGLIGHLFGLLIDLDLPQQAQKLGESLDDALARGRDPNARFERYKLLDRRARCELRLGRPGKALAQYRYKRHEATHFARNGLRELAGLLYTAAWTAAPDAMATTEQEGWLRDARTHLESLPRDRLGCGNEDAIYLLRSCAAWGWLRGDADTLGCVQGFLEPLTARLHGADHCDQGPPGLIFTFLHLARRDGYVESPRIPSWDDICVAMEHARYFIELAALASLMGRTADAMRYLDRVQGQRQLLPGVHFPDWFRDGLLADWADLCAERAEHERDVLGRENASAPSRLLESGLLPL